MSTTRDFAVQELRQRLVELKQALDTLDEDQFEEREELRNSLKQLDDEQLVMKMEIWGLKQELTQELAQKYPEHTVYLYHFWIALAVTACCTYFR